MAASEIHSPTHALDAVDMHAKGGLQYDSSWHFAAVVEWVALVRAEFTLGGFDQFRKRMVSLRESKLIPVRHALYSDTLGLTEKLKGTLPFAEFTSLWVRATSFVLLQQYPHAVPLFSATENVATEDKAVMEVLTISGNEQYASYLTDALELCSLHPLAHCPDVLLLNFLQRDVTEPGRGEVEATFSDYKNYGHLFLREWRRRNCQFLARYCARIDMDSNWHKTLFHIERAAPSVRSFARLCACRRKELGGVSDNLTFNFETHDSLAEAVARMPENLNFVNISLDDDGTLTLTRFFHPSFNSPLGDSVDPVVVQLATIDKKDKLLERMRRILLDNDKSSSKCGKDPVMFWKSRRLLDKELEKLLGELQYSFFGAYAPLLLPLNHSYSNNKPLSVAAVASLSPREYLEKLRKKFTDATFSNTCAIILSRLLDQLSCDEWVALARRFYQKDHVPDSVTKKLVSLWPQLSEYVSGKAERNSDKKYTLLAVPASLSFIPWECLPIFKRAPLVSRIPSFHFFEHLFNKFTNIPKQVDGRNSYYVLNPSGDLADTQKRLTEFIERFKFNWRGLIGQAPTHEHIKTVLASHDLFLYIGHNSGERYFGRSIRESDCRAVAVLMGCSSAGIVDEGPSFDGRSAIYEYLIARCPSVIGCLWMVTDGEIDRFFMAMIEHFFDSTSDLASWCTKPSKLLIEGIVEARKACKLPYLTGAAVVAYGLPIASLVTPAAAAADTPH